MLLNIEFEGSCKLRHIINQLICLEYVIYKKKKKKTCFCFIKTNNLACTVKKYILAFCWKNIKRSDLGTPPLHSKIKWSVPKRVNRVMNMMFNCCKYIPFLLWISFWMSYMFKINILFTLYFRIKKKKNLILAFSGKKKILRTSLCLFKFVLYCIVAFKAN